MFTGIIQDLGRVTYFSRHQKRDNLKVKSPALAKNAEIGDSISVNGVCLTVAKIIADILCFDLLAETIQLTNLGLLSSGDYVNLEESLRANGKLSGHFVTGHIDCLGTIKKRGMVQQNESFEVEIPLEFMKFLVPKGAIAVDGISLTVVDVYKSSFTPTPARHDSWRTWSEFRPPKERRNHTEKKPRDLSWGVFTFYVIPHTLNQTVLHAKKAGDTVNIECDILAKYHQRGLDFSYPAR